MKAGAGKSEIILAEEYLEIEDFAVIHRTRMRAPVVIQRRADCGAAVP